MEIDEILRLIAAILGDAFWKCSSEANRELLTELAAMRKTADEMRRSSAAE